MYYVILVCKLKKLKGYIGNISNMNYLNNFIYFLIKIKNNFKENEDYGWFYFIFYIKYYLKIIWLMINLLYINFYIFPSFSKNSYNVPLIEGKN